MNKALLTILTLCVFQSISNHGHALVPIFYSPSYNISFSETPIPPSSEDFFNPNFQLTLEQEDIFPAALSTILDHIQFDGEKYGKVARHLARNFTINSFRMPREMKEEHIRELLVEYASSHAQPTEDIHDYYNSIKTSNGLAKALEVSFLATAPYALLHKKVVAPMLAATTGTIEACQLAMAMGWAINLGGGFHHASATHGGGFCLFPDIPLAIILLWKENPTLKILIVDLDAHQGNGHEVIFEGDLRVAAFDMYNHDAYPSSTILYHPTGMIRFNHAIAPGTQTKEYLSILKENLPHALDVFAPNLIIFNAGTDILEGDPAGRLAVSAAGVVERDRFVFELAEKRHIPIAMMLSGGYTPQSIEIIQQSLTNILRLKKVARRRGCTVQ